MSNQERPKLSELIKSLKTHKDAILILGDKVAPNAVKITESSKETFNRKCLVKSPSKFWEWYNENVFFASPTISNEEVAINELIKTGVFKLIINLNNTNHINSNSLAQLIELRGNKTLLRCMTCNSTFEIESKQGKKATDNVLKCTCGGKIAPTVTMFGEKYRETDLDAIKKAIFIEDEDGVKLNTHTIIFVGVDFEEDYMHELMESYNAIKITMPKEDHYYTVMVCDKDGVSIDYYKPEFATYEDIAGAISRLTDNIKGE